jgi:site-specific recombinase XerD
LRHTFASAAIEGGTPLYTTGALLGITDTKSTARYGHLSDDPLKRAADDISATIAARLEGRETPVLRLARSKK